MKYCPKKGSEKGGLIQKIKVLTKWGSLTRTELTADIVMLIESNVLQLLEKNGQNWVQIYSCASAFIASILWQWFSGA